MPGPGPGEVRVKVRVTGVGATDITMRRGSYPYAPPIPFVPGYESIGVIDAVGEGVKTLKEGDRVGALLVYGGYATHVVRGAGHWVKVPDGLDDVQAVALWDPIVQGGDAEAELAEIRALQALDPARQHDVYFSDVLAYPLTDALSADIAAVDLCRRVPRSVRRMLVLETGAENGGRRVVDLTRVQGATADYRRLDEARVWAREPYQAIVPREGMAALLAWIGEASR